MSTVDLTVRRELLYLTKLLLSFLLIPPQHSAAAPESEQLIVFVQPNKSPVEDMFRERALLEIRNFIRTSRFVPQGDKLQRRENIPVWTKGRSRVWAPLKVAPVSGTRPDGYNHDAFVAQALKGVAKGFSKFRIQKEVELDRADRGFYMEFNPWLSEDGTLFITVVVFSQFDCKTPVYSKKS